MRPKKRFISKPRRFAHVIGFTDDVEYVEIIDGRSYLIFKNGDKLAREGYSLELCLSYVEFGLWKEII